MKVYFRTVDGSEWVKEWDEKLLGTVDSYVFGRDGSLSVRRFNASSHEAEYRMFTKHVVVYKVIE